MEDHIITQDSVKNCGPLTKEDEREKVKDFVYRHLMNDRVVLNKGHCRAQQGAVFSGKILSFGCSECKDSSTYSPNDLLKHFRAAHRGTLPTYPCDLCGFVTNEFSVLQRHRIEHRDTLVTCELCHDGVQYSLLLLTRHYNMCHSLNGQFTCNWCQFTTVDAGTFVQHIHHHKETTWKCAKCSHISLTEELHQKHLKSHSGTFPFTCPMCGYGCARNDYLKKHMAAVHKSEKKTVWTAIEDNGAPLNSSASLKLLLKKTSPLSGESKDDNQISKLIGAGVKANLNDKSALSNEVTGEAYQKAPETLAKRDNRNGKNSNNEVETSAADMLQEAEHSLSSDPGQISPNGMTVLRVKNKLSLPPNCTTKVIGFKMVDGKKHLVLKVIQASKQDDCAQPDPREFSNGRNSSMDYLQADDIMTVKVKVEEEETTVSNLESSPNGAVSASLNSSPIAEEHVLKNCDKDTSPHQQTTYSQRGVTDGSTAQFNESTNPIEPFQPSSTDHVENSEAADAGVLSHTLPEKHALTGQTTSSTSNENDKNGQNNAAEPSISSSADKIHSKILPTQEVFSFHNYSKETTSSSHNFDHSSFELSAEREAVSPDFSLTLAESPDPSKTVEDEGVCGQRNSECSSNVEVDGCISDVEAEENPESVLQDFNIIKIEEDNIPITKPPSNQLSPATDGAVNCNTGLTQQSNKETTECAGSENTDSTKQTKTTLRILQLPEGQQPVLLRTAAESRFAVPVQVKAPPGFKLITNSTSPHINVSYMNPAGGKTSGINHSSGVVIGANSKVVGVPTGKGATLLASSKPGMTSSSNHFLITSDLKRPLLLPRVLNGTPSDKTKTCYVVQRSSLPVVQSPPAPGLKLSGTPLSLNSRPLLALPVSSAETTRNLQSGRQTFLLRYVPPPKSGVSSQETKVLKPAGACTQSNDSTPNKVIFKIVSPNNSALSNASPVSQNHPVLFASRPQTQCFLLSSNNSSAGIKKFITVQNSSQTIVSESRVLHSAVKMQLSDADKRVLAPRPIRPPSQRKRRRKLLFDELPVTNNKVRKLSNKTLPEKQTDVLWRPIAKDKERTLRLSPQSSDQQVKWPRKYQPVVVLNHPDVDIPEVASIMKVVQRHQGAVTKVSLSQKTIQALNLSLTDSSTKDKSQGDYPHPRTVQSLVRERYLLKLKLKRKNKKKYRLVRTVPRLQRSVVFTCWFCGRLFNSQEAWIGHGQRHLLEATRDWNSLV